ncbi:MAG: ribosome recycling factor [Proteobacteria bacterium]|nr:ribosome recycling factor [Pseudomonadota bacterium]
MVEQKVFSDAEERMKKAFEHLKRDFTSIRTGRATPSLLDRIHVEAYGQQMQVNQLASVTSPEPRMLVVTPYDKSVMASIEKAIQKSDLGINPTNDGTNIRLLLPSLNEERRKDLVKQVKKRTEEGKVALRNVRRDAIEEAKKQKDAGASEDDIKRAEQQIQKMTDKFIAEFDQALSSKEKEILEI